MKRKIIKTGDGSTTIQLEDWGEQYHSMHGAVQEAKHVFLRMGFDFFLENNPYQKSLNILEIGFGTGLNALLTAIHASEKKKDINYEGVEKYPVLPKEIEQLNYVDLLERPDFYSFFEQLHAIPWDIKEQLTPTFSLKKRMLRFEEIADSSQHQLIYFDAFGAQVQPELWNVSIFKIMYNALTDGGVLVTYSAKGSVRRAMQEVGFIVERLPGPPGKREMLRAVKS